MLSPLAPTNLQHQILKPQASAAEQKTERQSIAFFDDLGLLVHDCDATDPSDDVVFKLLQMKTLLASAFQLQGFERGVAIDPHQQNLVVEFQQRERRYEGFKN